MILVWLIFSRDKISTGRKIKNVLRFFPFFFSLQKKKKIKKITVKKNEKIASLKYQIDTISYSKMGLVNASGSVVLP